jgi:hypothetical protein
LFDALTGKWRLIRLGWCVRHFGQDKTEANVVQTTRKSGRYTSPIGRTQEVFLGMVPVIILL